MQIVQSQTRMFKHEVEKAAKAIEDSILPNEYADILQQGYQLLMNDVHKIKFLSTPFNLTRNFDRVII